MDNLTEAKRQIDALPKVLKEDFHGEFFQETGVN